MNVNKLLGVYSSVSISICLWVLRNQFLQFGIIFLDSPYLSFRVHFECHVYMKTSFTIPGPLSQHHTSLDGRERHNTLFLALP